MTTLRWVMVLWLLGGSGPSGWAQDAANPSSALAYRFELSTRLSLQLDGAPIRHGLELVMDLDLVRRGQRGEDLELRIVAIEARVVGAARPASYSSRRSPKIEGAFDETAARGFDALVLNASIGEIGPRGEIWSLRPPELYRETLSTQDSPLDLIVECFCGRPRRLPPGTARAVWQCSTDLLGVPLLLRADETLQEAMPPEASVTLHRVGTPGIDTLRRDEIKDRYGESLCERILQLRFGRAEVRAELQIDERTGLPDRAQVQAHWQFELPEADDSGSSAGEGRLGWTLRRRVN
ncbi:MAG: hypothetical protein KDB53_18355 [Planctomycetes bacterium]|nr:hypothetical protein [Planctomycetota bacterium]